MSAHATQHRQARVLSLQQSPSTEPCSSSTSTLSGHCVTLAMYALSQVPCQVKNTHDNTCDLEREIDSSVRLGVAVRGKKKCRET